MTRTLITIAMFAVPAFASAADRPDVLVADFEGDNYADGWKTTGTAFGAGPSKGTLPNQMPVSGFLGKGLVNSYLDGDKSIGSLASPEFKIERKYLNFLIGGGKSPAKLCVNLVIGGKVVRTATGPNDKPGGSERLDWHTWDVTEFEGKNATIQIIDDATGGWGHLNVDHIVQSDVKRQAEPMAQHFVIEAKYLHLPVKNGAPQRRMKFTVNKQTVREFDIELATDGKPDFWTFADVSAFKGKDLSVEATLPAGTKVLDTLALSDSLPDAEQLYREKHRPLFHFTSRRGWLNDPNGLVYHDGEWHLFYQHNPYGVQWGNMHWGHAVSKDLFRWKELGDTLYPRQYGDWAFSGSAVVDKLNTSGWGTKEKPPLVLAYTSTGRGECMAFSNDNGRTWTEYDKNPVVKHAGRDPKLVWYEPGKHWVMAIYDEFQGKQWIAFHTSKDLKKWEFASRIEGFYECPDLVKFDKKWVLYAADGKYLVGDFDGKAFKPEFKEKKQLWYGRFYAAQTFDNARQRPFGQDEPGPNDPPRKVQIGWANGVTFPGMQFNQQMTVPVELELDTSDSKDPILLVRPVPEINWLHAGKPVFELLGDSKPTNQLTVADQLDAFDATLSITVGDVQEMVIDLRGSKLIYNAEKRTLTCKNVTAPAHVNRGELFLRLLVDRGSIEVFSGSGGDTGGWNTVAMSIAAIPDEKNRKLEVTSTGGTGVKVGGTVYRMKSAWEK